MKDPKNIQKSRNPLIKAIKAGNKIEVFDLLAKDANPDVKDQNGRLPLHLAIIKGLSEKLIFQLLLITSNLLEKDNFGKSPLDYANDNNNLDVISFYDRLKPSSELYIVNFLNYGDSKAI